MSNVIDLFKSIPDADCVFTDPVGVIWYKFLCEYPFDGKLFSFNLWAENAEDAEKRFELICRAGKLKGQVYGQR